MGNFRDMVDGVLPRPFAQELSAGFYGVLCSLTGDQAADAMTLALRLAWIADDESPDDVLSLIGSERGLPRYPGETLDQYRSRLQDAWSAYRFAGSEGTIVSQFAHAGYPGVTITFDAAALGPNGEAAPYWSQFWVSFPYSSGHPITTHGKNWGAFNYGDGTIYGLDATPAFYALIHGIVRKWKPSRWICRGFKFELVDTTIADLAFGI